MSHEQESSRPAQAHLRHAMDLPPPRRRCRRRAGRRGRCMPIADSGRVRSPPASRCRCGTSRAAASWSFSRVAAPRMPKITSACTPSRSMSARRRVGVVGRRMPRLPSEKKPVASITSRACWCPARIFWPEDDPVPPHQPEAPPPPSWSTYGPSAPSLTYGMRSRMAAEALAVKRSGGIQGKSMWQSAEIRVKVMASPSWVGVAPS